MAEIGERRTANYTTSESLKKKIEVAKYAAKDKYAICRGSARKLVSAYEALVAAEEKKEELGTRKAHSKYLVAEHKYNLAKDNYKADLSRYEDSIKEADEAYDELISMESAKDSKKTSREADRFDKAQANLRAKLDVIVETIGESVEAQDSDVAEIKVTEERTEPESKAGYPKEQPQYNAGFAGVGIAPMSIDISHIVEEAVSVAMEKFKAAFIKEADEFVESLPKEEKADKTEAAPVQELPIDTEESAEKPNEADGDAVAKAEEAILDEQTGITERLKELIEKISSLQDEITKLGEAYIEIANKQKEAAENERKINDLQRSLVREIQGVQANQKAISQEQSELYAEQTLFIEKHKSAIENQKTLIDAQNGIAEMQKSTAEAQATLEESISEVIRSHKDVIATQQSIIKENSKNIEAQELLTKRQAELAAMQKEAAAKHKQAARVQKNISQKSTEE